MDNRRKPTNMTGDGKQAAINALAELLYWKLSDATMKALEALTEEQLVLLLAEARDGVASRIQPFKMRIAQLKGG